MEQGGGLPPPLSHTTVHAVRYTAVLHQLDYVQAGRTSKAPKYAQYFRGLYSMHSTDYAIQQDS